MKTNLANKAGKIATRALMALFVVVLWSCHNNTKQDNDEVMGTPLLQQEAEHNTIVCTNKDNVDFEFMYDVDVTYPWSSYVSKDSTHVLKLEKVHSDEFGNSFRVLVFEPVYWRKGEFHFPELGSEPTFVGYGTDYVPDPDYVDFSFLSGFTDSDETVFVLSGFRDSWDSILVGNMCPPIDSDEEIRDCVFRKQSWDDIQSWWNTKQNR